MVVGHDKLRKDESPTFSGTYGKRRIPAAHLVCHSTVLWHSRRTLLHTWLRKHRNIGYELKIDDAYPPPCRSTSHPASTLRPQTAHPNLRTQRRPLMACIPAKFPRFGIATADRRRAQLTAAERVTSGGGGSRRESGLQGQEKRPISGTEEEAGGGGRGRGNRPAAGAAANSGGGRRWCGRPQHEG